MLNDYIDIMPTIEYFNEIVSTSAWYLKESIIPFYDLTYVIDGSSTYVVDDEEIVLESGDVIYIPKGYKRKAYTDAENPMHCFAFNFNTVILTAAFGNCPLQENFILELITT